LTKAEAKAQGRKALSTGGERLTKAEAKAQGRKALSTRGGV
jgi:hypothetical protein